MARRRTLQEPRLVTLTSDLGFAYAAQMKAALIAYGLPPSHIVDLAHDLPAHDLREGAFLFREMARAFPPASVHVAVIDPGVGGRRAPVAVTTRAGPILVGPDNGVLYLLAQELGIRQAHRIESTRFLARPRVGTTFDGRDLFAPAAALLASGLPAAELGDRVPLTPFSLPPASRTARSVRGEVVHVDRFGNLITSIPSEWIPANSTHLGLRVGSSGSRPVRWVSSYESLGKGSVGALGSSFGLVEVAVGEGRAADELAAGTGTVVELTHAGAGAGPGQTIYGRRPKKRSNAPG